MKIIEKTHKLIAESKTVGLVTHKNGDGDAFGSLLALSRILESLGKKVIIFSSEELIDPFKFMADKVYYRPLGHFKTIDLLICLDGNFAERFSLPTLVAEGKENGAKILVIDHHITGTIGEIADVYWVDENKSSTAELIFEWTQDFKINVDKVTATLLLMAIEMDTNSMQFTNTTPQTFQAVAELLKLGARIKPAVENAFGGKSLKELKLLGRVVERLTCDKNGVGISYITQTDHKELGIEAQKASGMVNFLEQSEDIKIAVVFEEIEGDKIKVSMRSNNSNVNVQEIGKHFGGGGHIKASGYEFVGTLAQATDAFKNYVKNLKDIDTAVEIPVS